MLAARAHAGRRCSAGCSSTVCRGSAGTSSPRFPSRKAELAGILPAAVGTLYLIVLTALIALPVGVGAAIYLEEYGKKSRLATLIEINIANLAGVPSIIYGLLGLGLFVRTLGLGRSLIAGAATLALLVLPMVVVSSREALRTVPMATREACLALGATRWQTIRQVVLPQALPGILTGSILAAVARHGRDRAAGRRRRAEPT